MTDWLDFFSKMGGISYLASLFEVKEFFELFMVVQLEKICFHWIVKLILLFLYVFLSFFHS